MADVFFDFEFAPAIVHGFKTQVPLSVGLVGTHGTKSLYLEFKTVDGGFIQDRWIQANVRPHLGQVGPVSSVEAARQILGWLSNDVAPPRFWSWYPAFDWVLLNNLCAGAGEMSPPTWGFNCGDLQTLKSLLVGDDPAFRWPAHTGRKHHALDDAIWHRDMHSHLIDLIGDSTDRLDMFYAYAKTLREGASR